MLSSEAGLVLPPRPCCGQLARQVAGQIPCIPAILLNIDVHAHRCLNKQVIPPDSPVCSMDSTPWCKGSELEKRVPPFFPPIAFYFLRKQ